MTLSRLLILALTGLWANILAAQDFRYTEVLFPAATMNSNVIYGTAPFINFPFTDESNTSIGNLVMDIYQPQGDVFTNRPAIIFAHSGGFITGSRNHDDMIAACDSFARKGYVTATIDYRQGFNALTNADLHGTRAVYRGIQDGRAAVRYLRANAATYGVDPNKIYLAGSSAGSFISLHSVYMDEPQEKPTFAGPVNYTSIFPPFLFSGPDLGSVDVGDNLDQNGTPEAIVAWWGAVEDTDLISTNDTEGVFLVHGSDDATVPFVTGPPFGLSTFPDVDGSFRIDSTLDALGLTNKETYFVEGAGHEFHGTSNGSWENGTGGNAYWDTLIDKTTNFLWRQHKPLADFSYLLNGLAVSFNDESNDANSWHWDFGDGQSSTDMSPTHSFAAAGTYWVKLYIENDILSWDTISYPITVSEPLPVVWAMPLIAEPQTNTIALNWSITEGYNHSHFVIEHQSSNGNFSPIGQVMDRLTANYPQTFHFLHEQPRTGLNTYRLRQVDTDGTYQFSNIATASIQSKTIRVYPNPSNGIVRINGLIADTNVKVIDALGSVQLQFLLEKHNGQLDLSQLPAGLYILQLDNGTQWRVLLR